MSIKGYCWVSHLKISCLVIDNVLHSYRAKKYHIDAAFSAKAFFYKLLSIHFFACVVYKNEYRCTPQSGSLSINDSLYLLRERL